MITSDLYEDNIKSSRNEHTTFQEDIMFSRFIKAIRPAGKSNFDTYLANLSKSGNRGVPTADEARRDYSAAIKASWISPRF